MKCVGKAKTVSIIGAGMGGLTLAIALIQRGFSVQVYEQTAVLSEVGAGLTVPATAMRVFDALGMWERVRDITVRSTGMTFVHYQTAEILHGKADREWTRKPDAIDQGGQTYRPLLHAILVDELNSLSPGSLHLGKRLSAIDQDDHAIRAIFDDGEKVESDLLVCCDGLRSAGYRALFGASNPASFTGVVAIRCLVPRVQAEPFIQGGRSMKYVGPRRGFSRYGVKQGDLINCIALAKTDTWTQEGWSHPCAREEFLSLYNDFHPDVLGLIEHAPADDIFKWALYDRDPLKTWSKGRATLLGDAAHPMLPYMAQGATAAFEDAYVLAKALDLCPDHAEAFARYEAARRPRTSAQMQQSRAQGDALNHENPFGYADRRSDFEGVANYDAVSAPL